MSFHELNQEQQAAVLALLGTGAEPEAARRARWWSALRT